MLKIKTYRYFTIKYFYPTIAHPRSITLSLSLSHRSWRLIFLLFFRQPNRIQLLPLSHSISRSWRLIFLLFYRQPNRIQSLPLSCSRSLIGLGGRFSCYFLGDQTDSRLNFSIILPPIRYFFYFSQFHCFKNLFLISLFFLRLEFWPYFVIQWEDFELLCFLFLNLKCYVKIEFVVLCIAHAQNTKTLHSLIQNVNLIFLNSCKMVSYT